MPFLCYLQKLHFGRYAFRKGVADAKAFWFIPLYQPFLFGRASIASEGLFSPATAKALATQTFAAERVLRAKAAFAAAAICLFRKAKAAAVRLQPQRLWQRKPLRPSEFCERRPLLRRPRLAL